MGVKNLFPSLPISVERVVERSKDRVSKLAANAFTSMHHAYFTHPDIASLVDPLLQAKKRVAAATFLSLEQLVVKTHRYEKSHPNCFLTSIFYIRNSLFDIINSPYWI